MKNINRIRPIIILRILFQRTDKDNYLTITDIQEILETEHNIVAYRTTIQEDIDALQEAGFSIECIRSTQNRYYISDRLFDSEDIKDLVKIIYSSDKADEKIRKMLIGKVLVMATGIMQKEAMAEIFSEEYMHSL